jgi:ubiquinone biosynthesis monooxygenase Coq7
MTVKQANQKSLQEIIRVNHAGEFGAKVIYAGQIAALKLKKDHQTLELVEEMKKQEDVHFEYFDEQLKKQKIRPTIMQPIWRVGGFALGFLTALADKRAAMACTTAVEEVIDEHYQSQLNSLKEEKDLKEKIEKFRAEELEHRDIGYKNHAAEIKYFKPLTTFIKATTKFAITVSKKI